MSEIYRALATPPPLRDQVYLALEELILEGHLSAGERLVESQLAARLEVSRGPIREALQLLERDGWLEVLPRRGTYVRVPTERELDDYFGARTLLEVEAARQAARRVRDDREATARLLSDLDDRLDHSRELSEQMPDEVRSRDISLAGLDQRRRYRDNSQSLHETVARLSGNAALVELLNYVSKRTRWYFASSAKQHRSARRQEHHELIVALRSGDEDAAADRMTFHMEQLREAALEGLRNR